MTDRAKEVIFGTLGDLAVGARVLDLFAGSGSLGLEALSRGAEKVIFVERGPGARRSLVGNLRNLALEGRAEVLPMDVFRALRQLEKREESFSLIFLDPPYNKGLVKKLLNRLDRSAIVTPLTELLVHHSRQEILPEGLETLRVRREKRIGQACLSFLSRSGK